jgi:glycosyltransferase involved in cell wall biosynthesis
VHIAVVYDCFFPLSTGGGERLYRAFAEHFARQGHQVTYVTRRQWEGAAPVVPGVEVVAIAGRARLYDARGNRRLGPAIGYAAAVARHLLRHAGRYDAVLVSALPSLNVIAARLALTGRRPVLCADFLELWRPEQWIEYSGPVVGRIARLLQRLAVRASPLASCHSQMHARRLMDEGFHGSPVVSPGLLHEGITADPSEQAGDPPTVVYVGRMIPDKQVETIPAAIAHARSSIPDLRAVLVGGGEQRASVEAEVSRLGLQDVIDVPGFVDDAALHRALRSAACLVNPSRREGYGLVVVEASAAGTPSVLVRGEDNAATELVEEGVNGFVAPSASPEDLADAIVRVHEAGPALRLSTADWFARNANRLSLDSSLDRVAASYAAESARS